MRAARKQLEFWYQNADSNIVEFQHPCFCYKILSIISKRALAIPSRL